MKTSETIEKITPCLIKAQAKIGAAVKGTQNPFFKKPYADLGAVMEACKEHLLEEGLCVIQPVGHDEKGQYVETVILHASGQFISDRMSITCAKENDPQAQGSAITYARRYALQSMLFIPAEDDDAEGAMNRGQAKQPSQQKTARQNQTDDDTDL